jgi:flagellar hook assembly protein FlgD
VLWGAVVHHTAGSSDYRPEESAAIVRGIQLYHVKANGWKDIGYNFLVDRFGQVFEGRAGGAERNVIGAHTLGFNKGSAGVAVLGTYSSKAPSKAAERALAALLAWRLDVGHVDPAIPSLVRSGGNPRFSMGTPVALRGVSGHRDADFTACPGDSLYSRLGAIVEVAATTGLPKLYEPFVRGAIGKTVRVSARLSQPLEWTVTVKSPSGEVVARKSGVGDRVNWTWRSAGLAKGRYTWTIEAGPDVRPARGIVGGASLPSPPPPRPRPLLSGLTVTPQVVSPNGDGFGDVPTVSYRLSQVARVTATITDWVGAPVAVLFSDQRQSARPTSFPWPLDAVPDGQYTLTIAARTDGGTTAKQTRTIVVTRALGWLRADPPSFSPDGDGSADTITFSFSLAEAASVSIEVRRQGVLLATVFAGWLEAGQQAFLWDGRLPAGTIASGSYEVWVTALDDVGRVTQTASFGVTQRPG